MKRSLTALIFCCVFNCVFNICKADHWTRKADFPGGKRRDAFAFAIGSKAYVGGGTDSIGILNNDLWEYIPGSDTWIEKSNTPFTATSWQSPAFSLDGYGYILISDTANQLWQYNPGLDTWTQKAALPGVIRMTPAYFVIGNKFYLGGGYNGYFDSSFSSYDPSTDSWTSIAPMPYYFEEGYGFSANNNGYITGIEDTLYALAPFVFEYNPLTNSWAQKANFPGAMRTEISTFKIGNVAYVGVGDMLTGGILRDWWEYNAYSDTWYNKDTIPCISGKDEDPAVTVNDAGYIFFGADISENSEVWEYAPDSVTAVAKTSGPAPGIELYPNPCAKTLTIKASDKLTSVSITNLFEQVVYYRKCDAEMLEVDVAGLPPGLYLVIINGSEIRRFLKE